MLRPAGSCGALVNAKLFDLADTFVDGRLAEFLVFFFRER